MSAILTVLSMVIVGAAFVMAMNAAHRSRQEELDALFPRTGGFEPQDRCGECGGYIPPKGRCPNGCFKR